MSQKGIITLFASAMLLQGCVESYKFSKEERSAHLVILTSNSPLICVDDEPYSISKAPNQDYFVIPAEKRITILGYASYDGYPVSYTCMPRISLVPEDGQTYLMDLHIIHSGCFLDIVRENDMAPLGLSREISLGPSICDTRRKKTQRK